MSLKNLGRYELVRVLGKGAMGLVYEGRDPNLERRVAIKTIKVENLSAEAAAEYEVRFGTEARSAARLQHPNIVSVYDSGRDGDTAFLVMEFIQGDDLKHHLDQGDVYTLEQTLAIMSDLLSALEYAHLQSIVHRDIKPANLLIEKNGRIKLTDFGVARIQDSAEATRTQGSMVGTLKYMSPEQVQGRPVDARADIFAAGIVLYQLLTGKRPFDGATDFAIIQQIVGLAPAPPTSFNSGLPPAIDAVLARALAKSRDERYSTAREFASALQAAARQAADPTTVPPASPSGPGSSTTWTATLRADEGLVGMYSGTSGGLSLVTQELELVYWKDIKESTDVEDLQVFLAKFPSGIYGHLARRRLKKLGVPGLANGDESDIGFSPGGTGTLMLPRSAASYEPTMLLEPGGARTSTGLAAASPESAGNPPADAIVQGPAPGHGPALPVAAYADTAEVTVLEAARVVAQPEVATTRDSVSRRAASEPAEPQNFKTPHAMPVLADVALARPGPLADGGTSVASAPAAKASSPSPLSRRLVLAMAGLVLLAGVAMGVKRLAGSDTEALPFGAAVSAPLAVPAAARPVAENAAAGPAASSVASTATAASKAELKAAQKLASEKEKLAPLAQASSAATQAPDASAAEVSAKRLVPVAAHAPVAVVHGSPRQACEDRMLLGFQMCMAEQCARRVYGDHPVCLERHAMDERRRESEHSGR